MAKFTIEDLQDKLKAETKAREYAEENQRVVRVPVEKRVLYEKCRACHKSVYDTVLVGFVAYSLLVTIFATVKSKVFVNDVGAFFVGAWNVVSSFISLVVRMVIRAAQITNGIQNATLADALYWLIVVVIVAGVIGGIGFGLFVGLRKFGEIYKECCWDRVSVMVATISLAIAVYFGEGIKKVVSVNLVVVLLIVHGVYVGVRWYVKGWRRARGYW